MQTRIGSAFESALNVISGFVLSVLIWQTVGPLFGYEVTLHDNFWITSIFTVASLVRSYLWRRYFNWRVQRDKGNS